MSDKLYVEGGGESKVLRTACRKGFRRFIEKAGVSGRRIPRIVACGGRRQAYDSFVTAHSTGDGNPMLLVDSEGPVTATGAWEHLREGDRWERPSSATDDQCHLMVQVMESWFLADRVALAAFYGSQLREAQLPANPQAEQVPKADVLEGLRAATRDAPKGRYDKGKHSFEILALVEPNRVASVCGYADRFLDALRGRA